MAEVRNIQVKVPCWGEVRSCKRVIP